jgi:predicted O-methyltransferase YrrM
MNKEEIDRLALKYEDEFFDFKRFPKHDTQYDDRSALINYSFIREYYPKTVVEFGAFKGRVTIDILRALLANKGEFTFRSYEKNPDYASRAQSYIAEFLKRKLKIYGDITKAKNVPNNIDYLFIDNSHDKNTTKWVFKKLLKKCKKGCLVQIHDICFIKDFELGKGSGFYGEQEVIQDLYKKGKLPLKKLYWTFEEEGNAESSWWTYEG